MREPPPLSVTSLFQHISCMTEHEHFSPEELRVNDYDHGRGPSGRANRTGDQARGFTVPASGLVAASLPSTVGFNHPSCRTSASLGIDLGAEGIVLRVGKEGDTGDFLIHRPILTRRSAFMKEALEGEWKEARSGVIAMPDDEPEIVALYQKWLYSGRVFSKPPRSVGTQGDVKEYEKLVKCFVLGEKLLDGTFKDCVVDTIVSVLVATHLFDPTLTELIYENTPPSSPLRKLWQDVYIFCGSTSWLDDRHGIHSDFVLDLSRRQMGFWQGLRPQDGAKMLVEPCAYHEHAPGKCYRASSLRVCSDGVAGLECNAEFVP